MWKLNIEVCTVPVFHIFLLLQVTFFFCQQNLEIIVQTHEVINFDHFMNTCEFVFRKNQIPVTLLLLAFCRKYHYTFPVYHLCSL